MLHFTALDYVSFAWFAAAWIGYALLNDHSPVRKRGLNHVMDQHRRVWMAEAARREMRILDTNILASLQNGTAFFASTSMIALGASFSMLTQADRLVQLFHGLPLDASGGLAEMQLKLLGLAAIFGYAFFQFGWSYRLFNYAAILLGAIVEITDRASSQDLLVAQEAVKRPAAMQIVAGRHFNRGLRALFFAIGYLGIFVGPVAFMASTAFILIVLLNRQYASAAFKAARDGVA